MKCLNCQLDNPGQKKYCRECGVKLPFSCPKCGVQVICDDNFCGECGHLLDLPKGITSKELSFAEKIEKLQKYLPDGLTEKVLSQRGKIEGENRQVTVMFVDMAGSTLLVEKLGPELSYTLMDQVYEILIRKVHDYGGTVNEMTGDGIMALFGAPRAIEEAPQRAIRSGYAIHREMTHFSENMRQLKKGIPPVKMRIGIHTGPVVVGTLGNDLRLEFKAVGDTVILASRMEGLAEPGATYVTEEIYRQSEGFFRFEALGERRVKGKGVPVKAFRVIAPSSRRTRFDVSAERGLSPFIGRDKELKILVRGYEHAKKGHGQIISIASEAGAGKSRLLYEFRKVVSNEEVTFLEGKCLSYSKKTAYHPIIDLLKSNFDIQDEDPESEIKEKIKKGLAGLSIDEKYAGPFLLELLSVDNSGLDMISLSPQARRAGLYQALIEIVKKGSEIRPLIVAIEDLHWIDNSSEEFINTLVNIISKFKIYILLTYRIEFKHALPLCSNHHQVNIERLPTKACLKMIYAIMGTQDIEPFLKELILEKSAGIPFFVEEIIKSLKELNLIEKRNNTLHMIRHEQGTSIPGKIQDVIMSRIDSLPQAAKEVLQAGSVIEKEFGYRLIQRVADLPESELRSVLDTLINFELIYVRGTNSETRYVFKHALTCEVVYDSILSGKKKILHERIGNALEDLYRENIPKYYSELARHFVRSENFEKGAEYSKQAARKAEQVVSFNEAISQAEQRIACLEKMDPTDKNQKRTINARTALGFYLFRMNYLVEAKTVIDPIYDVVLKSEYTRKLPLIFTLYGAYFFSVEENFAKAIEILKQAMELSEDIQDIEFIFYSNLYMGIALAWECEFENSSKYIQNALDTVSRFGISWNISALKSNLSYYSYNPQGQINLGYKTSQVALEMAEENGDIYSRAIAYTTHGVSNFYKGYFGKAENCLLTGIELSGKISLHSYSAVAYQYLGYTYFELERYAASQDAYQKAMQYREWNRLVPSGIKISIVALAKTQAYISPNPIDLGPLYQCISGNKLKLYAGSMARFMGEICLKNGKSHLSEAEEWIKKAVVLHRNCRMDWDLANDFVAYAVCYIQQGNQSTGETSLAQAKHLFETCGADGWLAHVESNWR